jgi:hypothetical protein
VLLSRPLDEAETRELCDLAEEATCLAQLEKQRKLECNQTVLIDSICPKSSLGIPPLVAPTNSTPPTEQPTATNTTNQAPPAEPTPVTVTEAPKTPPIDASEALQVFTMAAFALFVDAPAAFIAQHNHNLIAHKMDKLSKEQPLLNSAQETVRALAKENDDAIPKSISSIVNESVDKASRAAKCKQQSKDDELRNMVHKLQADSVKEKQKRFKLEQEKQALKCPNDGRAQMRGATQQNPNTD